MSDLWQVIRVQYATYRQKPILNIGFVLSLAIATSTLLSILMLNHASRTQYQQANSDLASPVTHQITPKEGQTVSAQAFVRLRKLGFSQVSPVQFFAKPYGDSRRMAIKTMDLLPMSMARTDVYRTDSILLPSAYAEFLDIDEDTTSLTFGQTSIPIHIIEESDWGMMALMDIELAQNQFPDMRDYHYLLVAEMSDFERSELIRLLPANLLLEPLDRLDSRAGFADALHLNLMALAILGFVVSLFIAYQSANQAWRNRSVLASQLRLLGVELRVIRLALIIEAIFLVLMAASVGVLIAIGLVSVLLPLLGLTLNQLYQLRVSGHFEWQWAYLLWSLGISAIAVFAALVNQFKQISSSRIALTSRQSQEPLKQKPLLIVGTVFFAAFLLWPKDSWLAIMIGYGVMLLATITLLPIFLHHLMRLVGKVSASFKWQFLVQDAANQIAKRFLPLAAFYLALTTSIAAALLVNSFESAFTRFLDQHLNEDLYVRYQSAEKDKVITWLKDQSQVKEIVPYYQGVATWNKQSIELTTFASEHQLESIVMKAQSSTALGEKSCFINEQFALKFEIDLGQELEFRQQQRLSCQVQGIYYDYGNPRLEITLPLATATANELALNQYGLGVYLHQQDQAFRDRFLQELDYDPGKVYRSSDIKDVALSVFSQTFILTQAIAAILLTIACFGLFLSAKSIELARKPELLTLHSLGLNRREIFAHMLNQWLILTVGCILLSWPIATVLAQALVAEIFPASFGWSMVLVPDISTFIMTSFTGLICLIPALAIPLYRFKLRQKGNIS